MTHPLDPYAYEVEYRAGARLRWDSPGGPWGERRLPVAPVRRLIVLGHPAGPLNCEVSQEWPVTGFLLRLAGSFTLPGWQHTRRFLLGVRHGPLVAGWRIDEQGRAAPYQGPAEGW